MDVGTVVRYLIGNRQAILTIASCRHVLWVGLCFVIAAGFAREYDGEYLLAEPWHIAIPIGASLATSFLLFCLSFPKVQRSSRPPFFSAYRAFLALFWMTAPLAWLYAIPYERFLSPADSVGANLATLGLVAAWRMFLMVRVLTVLMGYRWYQALFIVLLFGDAVAQTILQFTPLPIFSIMGGIRLTDSERLIRNVACGVSFWGILTMPIWLSGSIVVWIRAKPTWQLPPMTEPTAMVRRPLIGLAIASIAIWAFFLPKAQREQQLRWQTERMLRRGETSQAFDLMSSHSVTDYPPHWEPPPRIGYGEDMPPLLDAMELVSTRQVSPWIRAIYLSKFEHYLDSRLFRFDSKETIRVTRLIRTLPETLKRAVRAQHILERILERGDLPAEERENLENLLKEIRNEQPERD